MKALFRKVNRLCGYFGFGIHRTSIFHVEGQFRSSKYLRQSARRMEYLASLSIPIVGQKVLELGAGIGDQTEYYLDRECQVTVTDVKRQSLNYLKARYPELNVRFLDVENPPTDMNQSFDIIHCFGLLYHVGNPSKVLDFIRDHCAKYLFLETVVTGRDDDEILYIEEPKHLKSANSGMGSRPSRSWLFNELKKRFEHVYVPHTQPNHDEFPLDWKEVREKNLLGRAFFIASREPISNHRLSSTLIDVQSRHY